MGSQSAAPRIALTREGGTWTPSTLTLSLREWPAVVGGVATLIEAGACWAEVATGEIAARVEPDGVMVAVTSTLPFTAGGDGFDLDAAAA